VLPLFILAVALSDAPPKPTPFPLRTDPPPKEWRLDQIKDGLPYRWEKGAVHILAWEVIEDDRPHQYTQILVLKRFDQLTERGGGGWGRAHAYPAPADKSRPGSCPFRPPPPVRPGETLRNQPDAWVFGHQFSDDPPTDKQLESFLCQTLWRPK